MPDTSPAGFAALAADAHDTFEEVRALHERQRDEGDGWYLAARPAPPDMPFAAEVAISGAEPASDVDALSLELTRLREVEANMSTDAPEGDAYETAVNLLTWQLRKDRPSALTGRIEIYGDTYSGPVIDQWRQTLQPADGSVLSTRRLRRLLATWDRENLLEVLRGPGDMHVAVLKNEHGDIYFHAEWPYDLPQAWNERTIIAADHDSAGAVFALTPTTAGQMRVDPLPLEPGTGPSFGYGYDGGSPYTLYQALIRCAFSAPEAPFTLNDVEAGTGPEEVRSDLWRAITTTQGPLRLPWPRVLHWARADAVKAGVHGKRLIISPSHRYPGSRPGTPAARGSGVNRQPKKVRPRGRRLRGRKLDTPQFQDEDRFVVSCTQAGTRWRAPEFRMSATCCGLSWNSATCTTAAGQVQEGAPDRTQSGHDRLD